MFNYNVHKQHATLAVFKISISKIVKYGKKWTTMGNTAMSSTLETDKKNNKTSVKNFNERCT